MVGLWKRQRSDGVRAIEMPDIEFAPLFKSWEWLPAQISSYPGAFHLKDLTCSIKDLDSGHISVRRCRVKGWILL